MDKIETVIIEPPKGLIRLNLKEIWRYRELLYILIWRNIKIRYKQTVVGLGWVIFQPLVLMVIYSIFFGKIAKIPTEGIPYPIFIFSGLIFWNYFSTALSGANGSLIDSQGIIQKIYFPRLIIPLTTTITPFVDFLIVFVIFFGLMGYYHFWPNFWGLLLIPVLLLILFFTATGIGLFAASIYVKYRDVQYLLGFLIQVLFFATPILYPVSLVPSKFQWVLYLNPVAGVVEVMRQGFLGVGRIDFKILALSFLISTLLIIIGLFYFKKSERYFADTL